MLVAVSTVMSSLALKPTPFAAKTSAAARELPSLAKTATVRRSILVHTLISTIAECVILARPASALDLRLTNPDQTLEEAQSSFKIHVQSLLGVKDLLAEESWKEAQKALRKSSSKLKLDIYTIIQAKPPQERQRLRKLYSDLFNAVTKLDYAARDKDRVRVWDCWSINSSQSTEKKARNLRDYSAKFLLRQKSRNHHGSSPFWLRDSKHLQSSPLRRRKGL